MSTVKSKKLQVGTDASASNNFTIYQPSTPDGTLRIGVGNADSPTEVGRFDSNGYVATKSPAFSAYLASNQTVSPNGSTKVTFNTELFDTNSNFDSTTNYRFTPNVAGYYQINFMLCFPTGANNCISQLYKNGSLYLTGTRVDSSSTGFNSMVSDLVYFNGTTDYVEGYGYTSGTTFAGGATGAVCRFSGFLVRAV